VVQLGKRPFIGHLNFRSLPIRQWSHHGWDLFMIGIMVCVVCGVTFLYIEQEQNFYWWIGWWGRTWSLANLARSDLGQFWQDIRLSLTWERNSLYTLPLLPWIWVFGQSRTVYTIALAVTYLIPFCLGMGAIAQILACTQPTPAHPFLSPTLNNHRSIFKPNSPTPRQIFWGTAWLTLLLPVNWMATFLGIPDTGSAALILWALWVYLKDPQLKQRFTIVLIGLLLAGAIIIRRHFSYGAIALMGAIAAHTIMPFIPTLIRRPQLVIRPILKKLSRLCLLVMVISATLLLVVPEFTMRALTINYRVLYASWSLPLDDTLHRYLIYFGGVPWLLAILGWFTIRQRSSATSPPYGITLTFSTIGLGIWLIALRYGNVFYALHISHFVVLGMVFTGIWIGRQSNSKRNLLSFGIGLYLITNAYLGFTGGNSNHPLLRWFLPPLFSQSMPPLVQTDQEELIRLVRYLQNLPSTTLTGHPALYVNGFQRLQLSPSLLRSIEYYFNPYFPSKLNLLQASQVNSDGIDSIPALLNAEYMVIADPLWQYPGDPSQVPAVGEWVLPQETQLLNRVLQAFKENWSYAQSFELLPEEFHLARQTVVRIYKRKKISSLAAVQPLIGS